MDIPEPDTLFDDYANRSEVLKDNEMMIAEHMMYDYDLKVTGSTVPDALGRTFKNAGIDTPPARYDFRSIHADKFGGRDGSLYSKQKVLRDLKAYVAKART